MATQLMLCSHCGTQKPKRVPIGKPLHLTLVGHLPAPIRRGNYCHYRETPMGGGASRNNIIPLARVTDRVVLPAAMERQVSPRNRTWDLFSLLIWVLCSREKWLCLDDRYPRYPLASHTSHPYKSLICWESSSSHPINQKYSHVAQ